MSAIHKEDLLFELGKALYEKKDTRSLLTKIEKLYAAEIEKKRCAQIEHEKLARRSILCSANADLFKFWKNIGCVDKRYRLSKDSGKFFSEETFDNYGKCEEERNLFINGECDLTRWNWISFEDLYKRQIDENGIEYIDPTDRFECCVFTWKDKEITKYEAFCYDRVTRLKSRSFADINGFDVPIKAVFEDIIFNIVGHLENTREVERLCSFKIDKPMNCYRELIPDAVYHKVKLEIKNASSFCCSLKSYEIDTTRKYRLTDEYTFEEIN